MSNPWASLLVWWRMSNKVAPLTDEEVKFWADILAKSAEEHSSGLIKDLEYWYHMDQVKTRELETNASCK